MQVDDEATIAEAVGALGQGSQGAEAATVRLRTRRGSISSKRSKRMRVSDEQEEAPMQKKMRSAEAEAGPAEAAAAVASTRGPERRQAMRSRMIVQKQDASEKYSLVRSATETVAEIDRVLEARNRAIADEAREHFGASTPEDARRALVDARRACVVTGGRDGLSYLVIDVPLQKRSRYYAFRDWAGTRGAQRYLTKQDRYGQ